MKLGGAYWGDRGRTRGGSGYFIVYMDQMLKNKIKGNYSM